jgi:hypothetical protein
MTAKPLDPGTYAIRAIQVSVQYYVAGRFAAAAHLVPVAGNLLHHAVEMLLKACIVHKAGFAGLHRRHELPKLWRAYKRVFGVVDVADLDNVIASLQRYEHIRYPDDTMREGAGMTIQFEPSPSPKSSKPGSVPDYTLEMPDLDGFVRRIIVSGPVDSQVLVSHLHSPHAHTYLLHLNKSPLS